MVLKDPADMHRIEDHLVKAVMNLDKIDPPNEKIDTKGAWKTIGKPLKWFKVFRVALWYGCSISHSKNKAL